jgi:hypothetical protein
MGGPPHALSSLGAAVRGAAAKRRFCRLNGLTALCRLRSDLRGDERRLRTARWRVNDELWHTCPGMDQVRTEARSRSSAAAVRLAAVLTPVSMPGHRTCGTAGRWTTGQAAPAAMPPGHRDLDHLAPQGRRPPSPAPAAHRAEGRPRMKGGRLPSLARLAATMALTQVTVARCGKEAAVQAAVITCLWYLVFAPPPYRRPHRGKAPLPASTWP